MMVEKQKRDRGDLDGPKSRITALCSMVSWHFSPFLFASRKYALGSPVLTVAESICRLYVITICVIYVDMLYTSVPTYRS